jgi:hypothetical protein
MWNKDEKAESKHQKKWQKKQKRKFLLVINEVVPGLEPGIREIIDFDVSKSHVLTATLYNLNFFSCCSRISYLYI